MILQASVFLLSWLPIYYIKSPKTNFNKEFVAKQFIPLIGICISTGLALIYSIIVYYLSKSTHAQLDGGFMGDFEFLTNATMISIDAWIVTFINLLLIISYWQFSKNSHLPNSTRTFLQLAYVLFLVFSSFYNFSLPGQKIILLIAVLIFILSFSISLIKLSKPQKITFILNHLPLILIIINYITILNKFRD